jgi:hypothetical protein
MADELKRCNMAGHPRTTKRKAATGKECASRKKVEAVASASEREHARSAPEKNMMRLPQEEVSRILFSNWEPPFPLIAQQKYNQSFVQCGKQKKLESKGKQKET